MIDAHCHLNAFHDIESIIRSSKERLSAIVTCGYSIETSRKAVEISRQYPGFVFPVVGVAPQTAMSMKQKNWDVEIPDSAVAVGEVGLDFHWGKSAEERGLQQECFEHFLDIAEQTGLPVVIHSRDSHDKVMQILGEYKLKGVVIHCFSGRMEHARIALERGYVLSFPPVLSRTRKEVAETLDIRLIVESDAPYVGKTPLDAIVSAELIAKARGKSIEEIDRETTETAMKIFGLGP